MMMILTDIKIPSTSLKWEQLAIRPHFIDHFSNYFYDYLLFVNSGKKVSYSYYPYVMSTSFIFINICYYLIEINTSSFIL